MSFNAAAAGSGIQFVYNITISSSGGAWKRTVNGVTDNVGHVIPTNRKITLNITINAGVTLQATSTSVPVFEVDSLFAGSIINIINNGSLCGRGGAGGAGGSDSNNSGPGGAGGIAMRLSTSTCTYNITNGSGFIAGGGGGGGGGDHTVHLVEGFPQTNNGGGGGGGGAGGGPGGFGSSGDNSSGASGQAGTTGAGGVGGNGGTNPLGGNFNGGNGGGYGATGSSVTSGGSGGNPGGGVIYNVSNTVNFLSGNDGTHIKGVVSTVPG